MIDAGTTWRRLPAPRPGLAVWSLHRDASSPDTILAGYERKQREVKEQADRIVAAARVDAATAAEQAKADLKQSIARRLAAAEDQIASAQAAAVKEVRDRAVAIAVAAAGAVLAKQMTAAQANSLIDDAISQVDAKLH